jgi:hypothetical protein
MFFVRSQVRHTGFELTQADDAWLLALQMTRFQNTQPLAYHPRRSPAQFSYQNCEPIPGPVIQPSLNYESHTQIVLQMALCMTYGSSRVRTGHAVAFPFTFFDYRTGSAGKLNGDPMPKLAFLALILCFCFEANAQAPPSKPPQCLTITPIPKGPAETALAQFLDVVKLKSDARHSRSQVETLGGQTAVVTS